MAVRDDFGAGEVLVAADLNDTFGSKADYPSGGSDGNVLTKSGTDTVWSPHGKILKVERETFSTERSTTSTSFVDYPFGSISITPNSTSSAVLLIAVLLCDVRCSTAQANQTARLQITDNSNNAISGAEQVIIGLTEYDYPSATQVQNRHLVTMIGYSTPASTSSQTYKIRFRAGESNTTLVVRSDEMTAQLYALEVRG